LFVKSIVLKERGWEREGEREFKKKDRSIDEAKRTPVLTNLI